MFLGFSLVVFASSQSSMNPSSMGNIMGKVIDASDNSPIEFSNVALFRYKDSSLVNVTTTQSDGKFFIPNVPEGLYRIKVSFVGYKPFRVDSVKVSKGGFVNIGDVAIQPISSQIGEVVVKGERSVIENKIDRKVFYVDKNIAAQSGNAADVLQQVPSVQVDAQGTVSLRGSENVNILINGKPTMIDKTILLQQLPANTIEKIEVITNPSAKYDPEGTGGIINIVLKEGAGSGTSASLSVNVSNNDKYNASANITYNPGKLNIYSSYSFRNDKRKSSGYSDQVYLFNNSIHNSDADGSNQFLFHMARLGFDYNLTSSLSFGAGGTLNTGERNRYELNKYYNLVNNISNDWSRDSKDEDNILRHEVTAYMQKKFNNLGHEWRIDYTYNDERSDENTRYLDNILPLDSLINHEFQKNSNTNYRHTIQSDYTLPFNENSKLELGFRITTLKSENDQNSYIYVLPSTNYITDTQKTSTFFYNEDIYALYGTYSTTINKFGIMVGLRAEDFVNNFHLINDKKYNNTFFALFPTLHTSYKLNENNEITISYSRRVNRPRNRMINPFPDYSDPQHLRMGNPHVKPEYINSLDFGYTFKYKTITFQPSVFYRITENMFTSLATVDTVKQINIVTFQNAKQSTSTGGELSIVYQPFKFCYFNLGLSAYQFELNVTNLTSGVKRQFAYNGKLMSNIFLPGGLGLQLSAFYRSPSVTPQGKSDPFYSFNFGMKKDFFKGKLTGSLTVNDIFNTMHFGMNIENDQQTGKMYRKFDSRTVFLGLTYKIGKNNKPSMKKDKLKKEENYNSEDNYMDDSMSF